jgi:hypothetical protein
MVPRPYGGDNNHYLLLREDQYIDLLDSNEWQSWTSEVMMLILPPLVFADLHKSSNPDSFYFSSSFLL